VITSKAVRQFAFEYIRFSQYQRDRITFWSTERSRIQEPGVVNGLSPRIAG